MSSPSRSERADSLIGGMLLESYHQRVGARFKDDFKLSRINEPGLSPLIQSVGNCNEIAARLAVAHGARVPPAHELRKLQTAVIRNHKARMRSVDFLRRRGTPEDIEHWLKQGYGPETVQSEIVDFDSSGRDMAIGPDYNRLGKPGRMRGSEHLLSVLRNARGTPEERVRTVLGQAHEMAVSASKNSRPRLRRGGDSGHYLVIRGALDGKGPYHATFEHAERGELNYGPHSNMGGQSRHVLGRIPLAKWEQKYPGEKNDLNYETHGCYICGQSAMAGHNSDLHLGATVAPDERSWSAKIGESFAGNLIADLLEAIRAPQGSFSTFPDEWSWNARGVERPSVAGRSRQGRRGVEPWIPFSGYGKTVAQAQRAGDKYGAHFPDEHFHVVKKSRLGSVMRQGLRPPKDGTTDYGRGFVFLHSSEKAARLHASQMRDKNGETYAILKVNSQGLDPERMVTDHAYSFGLLKAPPGWGFPSGRINDRQQRARMSQSGGPFSFGARAHWGRVAPEHLSVHDEVEGR